MIAKNITFLAPFSRFAATNQTELFIIHSGSHVCGYHPGVGDLVNDRLERVF
jgi:hypothetical protein